MCTGDLADWPAQMGGVRARLGQVGRDASGDLDLRFQELRDDMAMQQASTLTEDRSRRFGNHVPRVLVHEKVFLFYAKAE